MELPDEDADVSTTMCRSQPGSNEARASSRSLDTAEDFKRSEEKGRSGSVSSNRTDSTSDYPPTFADDDSTTMCRSQPGSKEARASSRSLDTSVNFKRSEEKGSTTMCRSQPGSNEARASSRSLDTSVNFKRSEEKGRSGSVSCNRTDSTSDYPPTFADDNSTTMCRSQPGSNEARASSRSLDTAENFKRSEEKGRSGSVSSNRTDSTSDYPPTFADDDSTTMCRSQPGSKEARASSRSLDTSVNFKRSEEKGSTTMCRSQPGSKEARASSRSLDTSVNFKGSEQKRRSGSVRSNTSVGSSDLMPEPQDEDISTTMCRSQPGSNMARASSRSLDSVGKFKGFEEMRRSGSVRSNRSVASSDLLPEPLDDDDSTTMCRSQPGGNMARASSRSLDSAGKFKEMRRSNRCLSTSEYPPPLDDDDRMSDHSGCSESDECDPRSPSLVTSKDSGISTSTGFSSLSVSREPGLSPQLAGPDDVACDLCKGTKLKAWKSCLTCVRSFCEQHVRDHYKYKLMQQHQLVEVSEDLDVYKENAKLKQIIRDTNEENRVLREEINSLKYGNSMPKLPAYVCKGKTPTAADVILDPETAHRTLVLSQDGKRVRLGQKSKVNPGPQRFDRWECVLAKKGFSSGRHYWQVEVNKEFTIGVMKSSAQRNGRFAFAPFQGYWCIFHFWLSFSALENHVVRLPINSVPKVLGVCVDVDEKWVTFYNGETKDQIYTFKDMKLEPGDKIYPIFRTVERSMDLQINTVKDLLKNL
ncbi:dentin sialophosphoprotein-like isoform X4 [Pangasianodon hypophthalmus]|uniref:dentin sialophosphoprotein-like isoform X4 n=1 Tax=Pangasianodon hypophthalmus TaxID=310915 RepID=UPI002306F498|nr:dentin sialophosphoprotein-like isoform X4 [Pangasianodon hypophthalmus]